MVPAPSAGEGAPPAGETVRAETPLSTQYPAYPTRRAAIDTNCNIDAYAHAYASLSLLKLPAYGRVRQALKDSRT